MAQPMPQPGEGVDFDVIGLSYYPFWHGPLAALRANLPSLRAFRP